MAKKIFAVKPLVFVFFLPLLWLFLGLSAIKGGKIGDFLLFDAFPTGYHLIMLAVAIAANIAAYILKPDVRSDASAKLLSFLSGFAIGFAAVYTALSVPLLLILFVLVLMSFGLMLPAYLVGCIPACFLVCVFFIYLKMPNRNKYFMLLGVATAAGFLIALYLFFGEAPYIKSIVQLDKVH